MPVFYIRWNPEKIFSSEC